jgi:hypothetical protein
MISTVDTVSQMAPASVESEVSLVRLYVLRAMYLVLVIGGGIVFVPQLFGHEPTARGVIPSMLGAIWLLCCFGLRYPLQMLPILLFELAWKTIWVVDYGLPQRMAGVNTPVFKEDFKAIAYAPLLLIVLIPWGYVFRHYLKNPGARWRRLS